MSSELKIMLNKVAEEDKEREEIEFEKGTTRYESLLLRIAEEKKLNIVISIEGVLQNDFNEEQKDLTVLEKAQLVKGETKYTHRNEYRQYELTTKGIELAQKLSKEKDTPRL